MEQYNGWSNYPTWALYNRLSKDEASYDEWIARATALADKMPLEDAVGRLAR